MNEVELIKNVEKDIPELEEVRKFIDYVLTYQKLDDVMFNVIIVDDEQIHELNKNYRGIDKPTDVISFALEDDDTFKPLKGRILGDIYISIDAAIRQSQEYGHSLLRELCFLTCHGILHLLGYDHMQEEEEKVMFALQERILESYGVTR